MSKIIAGGLYSTMCAKAEELFPDLRYDQNVLIENLPAGLWRAGMGLVLDGRRYYLVSRYGDRNLGIFVRGESVTED